MTGAGLAANSEGHRPRTELIEPNFVSISSVQRRNVSQLLDESERETRLGGSNGASRMVLAPSLAPLIRARRTTTGRNIA